MPKTRILIVEDEGIVALDIERQLLNIGHEPIGIAASGEEAIGLATRERPGLVLMDINLAGEMDGIQAATQIWKTLGIPSLFLTAYASDDIVARAQEAEPLGYVIKPFAEIELRTAIEIALHKFTLDSRLRASEARYRAVVESTRDGVVTVTPDGHIVDWSSGAVGLFGYGSDEVVGQHFAILIPEERRAVRLSVFSVALEQVRTSGLSFGTETIARLKDGTRLPVEWTMSRWNDGSGEFLTFFVRDISERIRATATTRLHSAALNAAANGIVITDVNGTIEWVNPAFSQLSGYALEEAVGHNPRELVKSGLHDESFYANLWQTITSGQVWFGEMTNRRKDGSFWTEEQSITPVRDEAGMITHFIAIKRDITSQKDLEAKFIQAQKMEVVGRLAGGVAHDFNNLLTIINGTSDLVLRDLQDDGPIRQDFQQVKDAGERAARLTRQLLAFSRKQLAAPVVLHLGTQVATTAKMLQRLIGEDVHLVVNSVPDQGHVRIDAGYFEQILLNLSVNARDAMPKGGSLVIETRRAHLDSALARNHPGVAPGRFVLLSVTDTGTGIAPDVRERIFEPFFTTKAEGNGTGLGLATVQHLVRESGGYITVDSEPGAGARLNVYLPEVSVPVEGADGALAGPVRGSEVVLIVEDDNVLLEVMMRMLSSAGYTALSASSGSLALELLAEGKTRVNLLLTDVVMPGMSGPELAAEVTRRWPTVKVLFTSGYVGDRVSPETLGPNAHFIAKPFTATTLTHKIRETLDGTPVAG